MPRNEPGIVTLEGVRIVFRNFEGKEGQFNKRGDRNFGVIIPDPETAEAMKADGWNIKYLKPREGDEVAEGEESDEPTETPWISVKVAYDKGRPPKIMLVTSRGRTALDEETVEELDWADITNVDLIISPYAWEVNGRSGISAYLKTMFVTIEEDALEAKYADMDAQ